MDSKTKLPWLLMPCVLLTLGSVTLLVPRRPALAAPPASQPVFKTPSAAAGYDDGDGDELLEHWGDPKYAREERVQMAGAAVGFLLLSGVAWRKRAVQKIRPRAMQEEPAELRKAA